MGYRPSFAVAAIGVYKMINVAGQHGRDRDIGFGKGKPGAALHVWVMLVLFFAATTGYIILCRVLVPRFPLLFLLFFGYIWTPLGSYINAYGRFDRSVRILPMVRKPPSSSVAIRALMSGSRRSPSQLRRHRATLPRIELTETNSPQCSGRAADVPDHDGM